MGKARAMKKALGQAGFAQARVVRPEAEALVIARDGNDAAILQNFGHAEVIQDAVIVVLAALGRANVVCIRCRTVRELFLEVNNGSTDAKRGPGHSTLQVRDLGE